MLEKSSSSSMFIVFSRLLDFSHASKQSKLVRSKFIKSYIILFFGAFGIMQLFALWPVWPHFEHLRAAKRKLIDSGPLAGNVDSSSGNRTNTEGEPTLPEGGPTLSICWPSSGEPSWPLCDASASLGLLSFDIATPKPISPV